MARADRLEILRKIERLPKNTDMESHLRKLDKDRREFLREVVDWVQKYEIEDMIRDS